MKSVAAIALALASFNVFAAVYFECSIDVYQGETKSETLALKKKLDFNANSKFFVQSSDGHFFFEIAPFGNVLVNDLKSNSSLSLSRFEKGSVPANSYRFEHTAVDRAGFVGVCWAR